MSGDTAIRVEDVSKKFCRSLKRSMLYGIGDIGRNLAGLKSPSDQLRKNEFWAVNDVSFEVKRGETLGIIGPNGSGKTTLLKMLNGIFWPDKGRVTVRGRVGALIAVGAGFHPLLSGRENIYINGAILGMSRREIDRKFDAIVNFADVGDFLDTPVRNYSSGMHVRLGFAIAVHCQPDILLVDEVLAVGDKDFQIKCYQKINEIQGQGTAVVLVSHNEYTIREYTARCVYLLNGKQKFLGASEEGISRYIRDILEHRSQKTSVNGAGGSSAHKKVRLLPLKFLDRQGREIQFLESGQELTIQLECIAHEPIHRPVFGVNFYDNLGFMYCANSYYEGQTFGESIQGRVRVTVRIPQFHLPANSYLCSTLIAEENPDNLQDWHNMAYKLVVGRAPNARGSIRLPTHWELTAGHNGEGFDS